MEEVKIEDYEYIKYKGTVEDARKQHEKEMPWFPFSIAKIEKGWVYIYANVLRKM